MKEQRIVYKKVTRTINGKPAPAEEPMFPTSAREIMLKVASANRFDTEALQTNREGRLTFSQFGQACKAILINLFFFASILALMVAVAIGFSAISSHEYPQAMLPCGGAVVMLFVTGWIFTKRTGLGVERYGAGEKLLTLFRRFLLPLDLILWRVSMLEGEVEKDKTVYTMAAGARSSNSLRDPKDYSATPTRRYSYFYRIGDAGFTATEEGYNVFPDHPPKCRIYYLPLSKVMVNLEVL